MPRCVVMRLPKSTRTSSRLDWHTQLSELELWDAVGVALCGRATGGGMEAPTEGRTATGAGTPVERGEGGTGDEAGGATAETGVAEIGTAAAAAAAAVAACPLLVVACCAPVVSPAI